MSDKIAPCLWFDGQAEQAARLYVSLLPDSRIDAVHRGPLFSFTEAVSLQIYCDDQAEVDRLTQALSAVPEAEQCGWVKDRFGLSWQIVPKRLLELLTDRDAGKAQRAMQAMLAMKRIDIAAVERAAAMSS